VPKRKPFVLTTDANGGVIRPHQNLGTRALSKRKGPWTVDRFPYEHVWGKRTQSQARCRVHIISPKKKKKKNKKKKKKPASKCALRTRAAHLGKKKGEWSPPNGRTNLDSFLEKGKKIRTGIFKAQQSRIFIE